MELERQLLIRPRGRQMADFGHLRYLDVRCLVSEAFFFVLDYPLLVIMDHDLDYAAIPMHSQQFV